MISHTHSPESVRPESIWTLFGVLAGAATGLVFSEVGYGASIGLLAGSIITMVLERKRQKKQHSRLVIGVSVLALVCIVAFRIIEAV